MNKNKGGCVCGRVRFATRGNPLRVTICHCTWCQRRTGSAFGVEAVFNVDKVTFENASSIQSYRHLSDESGRWVSTSFCSECGTNIGMVLEAVPGIRTISAGTFDNPSWLDLANCPVRHVYLRSAQKWSTVPDGVDCHDLHFRE